MPTILQRFKDRPPARPRKYNLTHTAINLFGDKRFDSHDFLDSALPAEAEAAATSATKSTSASRNFDQLYRNAEIEMGNLNFEKARKLYQEIDRLSGPASADKQGNGKKARIMLKAFSPLYPVTRACNDMHKQGDVLMRSQNPHDILAVFTDLANRYPKFEWAQTAMAAIYMRMKDTESAAQCARRSLSINEVRNLLNSLIMEKNKQPPD